MRAPTRPNAIFTRNSLPLNTKRTAVVQYYTQVDSCNDRLTPVLRVPVTPSKDSSATMNRTTAGEPVRKEASLTGATISCCSPLVGRACKYVL